MLRRIVLLGSILVAVLIVAVLVAAVLIDPDDYRDQIAARASDQIGREVRLAGPIELRLFPWLAFEIRDASVGNPPDFETAPPLAEIGLARAAIRVWPLLRGNVEIGGVDFEDATITLVTDRRGRSNLEGLFATAQDDVPETAPPDLSMLQTGPIALRRLTVSLLDLATGEREDIALDSIELDPFRPDQDVAFSLRGRFSATGEALIDDLHLDGALRVPADLGALDLTGLKARFFLPAADARIRAGGEARIDLSASAIAIELPRFELLMELPELALGLILTEALGVVLDDPIRVAMPAADFRLDDQHLALSGDLALGDPIRGRLDVSGERLDLRALAALGGGEDMDDADREAADLTPLRMFDFRSELRLNELILAEGLRLETVEASSVLSKGRLALDPMQANLFGGRFDGRAEVDFNQDPPHVHVQPRLTGVLVEQMAGLFSRHVPVAGSGDLALDLRFRGLGIDEILASLDGSGQFTISDGSVRGVDLEQLIEQRLAVSSLANVRQAFAGETRFRVLSGNLRAEDGVIELPDLDLTGSGFGARGSGKIDFAADRVDYKVELDLGEQWQARLPSSLREATGGRIPLAIAGPVTAPVVTIDLAGIAERALRDEAGRRLLERLDRSRLSDKTGARDEDEITTEEPAERERSSRRLLRELIESRERRSDHAEEADEPVADENEESALDPESDADPEPDPDPDEEADPDPA